MSEENIEIGSKNPNKRPNRAFNLVVGAVALLSIVVSNILIIDAGRGEVDVGSEVASDTTINIVAEIKDTVVTEKADPLQEDSVHNKKEITTEKNTPKMPKEEMPKEEKIKVPKPDAKASTTTTDNNSTDIIAIEDYGNLIPEMQKFYRALTNQSRPIRIAVLGDSFTENDIIVSDIREQLQNKYGGKGVGFIPFASKLATYRATAKQTFSNWKIVNILEKNSMIGESQNRLFVSGLIGIPEEGATTRIEGSTFRKHLQNASKAKLIFINEGSTTINVTINDTIKKEYNPPSQSNVQQIVISAPIKTISVTLTNTSGFMGYGISLEGDNGINVDSYSIRGNSGLTLLKTNQNINIQINNLNNYDLVILQYGLNVMSNGAKNYNSYGSKLAEVIKYVKRSFPSSAILVMGVSDRGIKQNGRYVSMPEAAIMTQTQRQIAMQTGVAFWSTYDAMGGANSIAKFVENKWAAKDHTHITYLGGKYIATKFVNSLISNANQITVQGSQIGSPIQPKMASNTTTRIVSLLK